MDGTGLHYQAARLQLRAAEEETVLDALRSGLAAKARGNRMTWSTRGSLETHKSKALASVLDQAERGEKSASLVRTAKIQSRAASRKPRAAVKRLVATNDSPAVDLMKPQSPGACPRTRLRR